MLEFGDYCDFYSGGPAVSLFLREPQPSGSISAPLLGKRPDISTPFYSLIPGWKFYSALTFMFLGSSSSCDLNAIFSDLILREGMRENFEKIEQENIDTVAEDIMTNEFMMSGKIDVEMACMLVKDDAPAVQEDIDQFVKLMDDFCIRDIINLDSAEVWHYIETMLQLISTKQYMSKDKIYNVNLSVFDYTYAVKLLESGISVSHEQNPEFLDYDLVSSEVTDLRYGSEESEKVYFMLKLSFSKSCTGKSFSSGNFR